MDTLLKTIDPFLLLCLVGSLFLFTLVYLTYTTFIQDSARKSVKKRLTSEKKHPTLNLGDDIGQSFSANKSPEKKISKSVAKKANDFYANSDPSNMKKMRTLLMQAGYFNPNAVGYFIASRFACGAVMGLLIAIFAFTSYGDKTLTYKLMMILVGVALGYFLPNVVLSQKAKNLETQNRQGFPDILDLMIVSSEAGLTMEASIERISAEIKTTYPILSTQLNLAALEIRAGRPIDQALRAFGERLRLEEIKAFATMIQQSKELGTSVTDALRVYSDEMRHKRMMKAEEKAYALPAKMSVPVTLFMLPTVLMIAIIPTLVRFAS